MGATPVLLKCPLCEGYVSKIEQRRDYKRRGLNVTIWHHPGEKHWIADEIFGPAKSAAHAMAVTPHKEAIHARA